MPCSNWGGVGGGGGASAENEDGSSVSWVNYCWAE